MIKTLLINFFLLSFVFSHTGMLSSKEESSMGVFSSYSANIEDTNADALWEINFEYMTGIGVEVSLNTGNGWKGLEIGYHYKAEKWNASMQWSRKLNDSENLDSDNLWLLGYSESAIFGGFGGSSINDGDWEFDQMVVGKLWSMENGISVGISYTFNTEEYDMGYLGVHTGFKF